MLPQGKLLIAIVVLYYTALVLDVVLTEGAAAHFLNNDRSFGLNMIQP